MRKSKVLSVAMSAVLVASLAAAASVSVSAEITKSADIPSHSVGVVGSFNGWANDIALTDEDGDGVYEGLVEIPEVTEDMFLGWNIDDEPTGESYVLFKVRLDGDWTDSWGNYEPLNDRTWNSQSNVPVKEAVVGQPLGNYEPLNDRTWNSQSNVPVKEAVVGQPLKFTVYFDIKNPAPAALANPDSYAEAGSDDYMYLNVYYKVEETSTPDPEPSPEPTPDPEPSKEDPSSQTPVTTTGDTSKVAVEDKTDSTAPATGDATSAAALAAVVVASLGIAVVMTKKASAK